MKIIVHMYKINQEVYFWREKLQYRTINTQIIICGKLFFFGQDSESKDLNENVKILDFYALP